MNATNLKPWTKAMKQTRFYDDMHVLGFVFEEIETLRRAQMTLHTWAERMCNGEIERDEKTGKTWHMSNGTGKRYGPAKDMEAGALKRIEATLKERNSRVVSSFNALGGLGESDPRPLSFYHQTDPRGCSLYILRPGDVPEGKEAESYYSRGFAVCY